MALLVPYEGEVRLLTAMLVTAAPALEVRLYKSTLTPTNARVLADYDAIQCTAAGYSAQTITAATDWTISTVGATTTATCVYKDFTFTAASDIYGYYVVDTTGTDKLVWAEEFADAPHQEPALGGVQRVIVTIAAA
jgi:hypothetical protein